MTADSGHPDREPPGPSGQPRVTPEEGERHLRIWQEKYRSVGRGLVAFRWLDEEGRQRETRRWLDFILPPLYEQIPDPKSKSVLDVGCGNGRWYGLLSEMFDTYKGTDILEPLVLEAKRTFPAGDFVLTSPMDPFPVPDQSQDLVWFVTVLQHITIKSMMDFILWECRRVLKPGRSVFAFENTHAKKSNAEIAYRSVEAYQALLSPLGNVRVLGSLTAHDEDHTAFLVTRELKSAES